MAAMMMETWMRALACEADGDGSWDALLEDAGLLQQAAGARRQWLDADRLARLHGETGIDKLCQLAHIPAAAGR